MKNLTRLSGLLFLCLLLFSQFIHAQESDTDERFYNWYSSGEINGKSRYKTRPYPGYVVLRDGNKIEGILEVLSQGDKHSYRKFKLETPVKEIDLDPTHVLSYGLYVRKDRAIGDRIHSEPGKNFVPGSITLLDGTHKNGFVAFADVETRAFDHGSAYFYSNVYFSEQDNGMIDYYPTAELDKVIQLQNGQTVEYQYMNNQFLNYENIRATKIFRQGSVTFQDGSTQTGELSRLWGNNLYLECMFFVGRDGNLQCLKSRDVQSCSLSVDGELFTYVPYRGVLVELLKRSDNFTLTQNPYPTTPSMFANFMADFATSAARGMVANEVARKIASTGGGDTEEFKEALQTASKEELMELESNLALLDNTLAGNAQFDDTRKSIAAQRVALRVAAQGRPDSVSGASGSFMRNEYIITHTTTGKSIIFVKSDLKRQVEYQLSGCSHFVMMPKKEQNQLLQWENMDQILAFMEQCY